MEDSKRSIAIFILLILTPVVVLPQKVLMNSDYLSHFALSFVIAFIYYKIMISRVQSHTLWIQTFVVCITIGVLKEIVADARVELPDIAFDLYGTLLGLRFSVLKV